MALIFEDTGRKRILAQNLLEFDTAWDAGEIFITLHSGAQPSDSDFLSNWSTSYYFDGSDGSVGTSVLGTYGDIDNNGTGALHVSQASNTGDTYSTPFSWALNDTDYTKTYKADGTVAWAVIWNENFSGLRAGTVPHAFAYIICPVSDASGTGVVKINSTTVSGSLPDLADINIEIS